MDKSGQSGEKHSFHKENSSLMNMLCFYEDLKKKKVYKEDPVDFI